MAVLKADGFDIDFANGAEGRFTSVTQNDVTSLTYLGTPVRSVANHGYLHIGANDSILHSYYAYGVIDLGTTYTELFIAMKIRVNNLEFLHNSRFLPIIGFRDSASAYQGQFGFYGRQPFVSYVSGTVGGTSTALARSTNFVRRNVWHNFEARVVVNGSTGIVQAKLNGETIIDASGLDTDPAGTTEIQEIYMGQVNFANQEQSMGFIDIDDLVIMDTTGTWANTWANGASLFRSDPSGTGTETDWTPTGAATSYEALDDVATYGNQPSTSEYIASSVAAQDESVDVDAIDTTYFSSGSSVLAVNHVSYCQNVDPRNITPYLNLNGTFQVGSSVVMPTSYDWLEQIFTNKSGSQIAWADVVAMEQGWRSE